MLNNRFWNKVTKTESCWNWTAFKNQGGYGQFRVNKKAYLSHRASYELIKGIIPEGLQIDHLCRNRACVNPSHLEAVTQRENMQRGNSPAAINARKTHCPQRHEYTKENTYVNPTSGKRSCKSCHLTRENQRYHQKLGTQKEERDVSVDKKISVENEIEFERD